MRWLDSITDSMDMNLSKRWEIVEDRGAWQPTVHGVAKSRTKLSERTTTNPRQARKCFLLTFKILIAHFWGKSCFKPHSFTIFQFIKKTYFCIWQNGALFVACKIFDLCCSMQGLLAVECDFLVAASGIWFPDQGWNLGLLLWGCGVLATGPPGKAHSF